MPAKNTLKFSPGVGAQKSVRERTIKIRRHYDVKNSIRTQRITSIDVVYREICASFTFSTFLLRMRSKMDDKMSVLYYNFPRLKRVRDAPGTEHDIATDIKYYSNFVWF